MDINNALNILGFDEHNISDISEMELKQQYRMYALKYHPDKNASTDASIRFLEIKEAYDLLSANLDILQEDIECDDINEMNYRRILKQYLGIQIIDNKINDVLDNILFVCEKQAIFILEKIEEKKFKMMYSILKKYKNVFFLSDEFYQQMEQINNNKNKKEEDNREIIEIYPTLNDLLQNMIYKLNKNDEIYLVPLWHHELIYEDKQEEEFIVRCIPNLYVENEHDNSNEQKKEYWIDEFNNLHCKIEYSISYIMDKSINKERIKVNFGENKTLYFNPWELNIIQTQTIHWKKEGISIPALELNDVTKKADILLYIYLSNT